MNPGVPIMYSFNRSRSARSGVPDVISIEATHEAISADPKFLQLVEAGGTLPVDAATAMYWRIA